MPLTPFQTKVAILLSQNRTEDSHLAGGAALHFKPDSIRFSVDLDYFHDSEVRVSSAFNQDQQCLLQNGYKVQIEMNQPGYIRSIVIHKSEQTKIEWAHDSSWRFMPVQKDPQIGYILHPIDLAINKLLALVGRDESRDYLDVHFSHENILPLGAQCWAACGKDPGFNPQSLLELLKRRGKYRTEDFERLNLTRKVDIQELKNRWIKMLADAETFVNNTPYKDVGCLYYSSSLEKFIEPSIKMFSSSQKVLKHFGKPGGVLPHVVP
jgi:hypothetical protein